jgi:drug/metabolite transporter (DMT)-like permease
MVFAIKRVTLLSPRDFYMYIGILYTLATAALVASADALCKKASQQQSIYGVSLSRWFFSLPVLGLMTYQMEFPRSISQQVILLTVILIPLEIAAMILYIKALSRYDLSMTAPLLSLTPLFLLITGSVFLGETITITGVAGVLLILLGIYVMNISHLKEGMLAPFKCLLKNEGAVLVIIVALIYTVTSTMGKKVVTLTGSSFFSFWYLFLLSFAIIPVMYWKGESPFQIFKNFRINLLIGTLVGLATYTIFTAYNYAPIAYVIAVKRTSIIFSVLLGRIVFKERFFGQRVVGAAIALAGIIIIICSP